MIKWRDKAKTGMDLAPSRGQIFRRINMDETTRDHGVQPLDGLMRGWGLGNHDLVEGASEQINHKQVQKARKGRQLTLRLMQKLTRALNETVFERLPKERKEAFVPYLHKHLFNYAKGHDAAWTDPNEALKPDERSE